MTTENGLENLRHMRTMIEVMRRRMWRLEGFIERNEWLGWLPPRKSAAAQNGEAVRERSTPARRAAKRPPTALPRLGLRDVLEVVGLALPLDDAEAVDDRIQAVLRSPALGTIQVELRIVGWAPPAPPDDLEPPALDQPARLARRGRK